MKALAGVLGVLVGLICVALGALYVVPKLKAGSGPIPKASAGNRDRFALPDQPLTTPDSDTDRLKKEIERKRVPFFIMIHEKFAEHVERASVLEAVDTLDLVIKKEESEHVQWLVREAIGPTARQYGFERVKFYVRNPVGTVEPFRIVAESSWDGAGRWNTFLK